MQAVRCGMPAMMMACKVWDEGYRLQDGCKLKIVGCGTQNKGYRVQAVRYRLQEKGCRMWDEIDGCRADFRLHDADCRMLDKRYGLKDVSSRM